jgi:hypothetical protein
MILANPIYDVVFKYLLEDLSIARDLLSVITGENIVSVEVKPQESVVEVSAGLRVFRYDFKAIIRNNDGTYKKVLIELQKAKVLLDVMRFRSYLGDNYSKADEFFNEETQKQESQPLPILTIYMLGFRLERVPTAALKVGRTFFDLITGQVMMPLELEPFIELLTHDSYIIQLKRLKNPIKTRLERVLRLFDQSTKLTNDQHKLEYEPDPNETDSLVHRIMERLTRAVADDQMRLRMRIEDELERTYHRDMRAKDVVIAEKEQIIEQKEQIIEQKEQIIEQKEVVIAEKEQAIEHAMKQIKQLLEQQERFLAQLERLSEQNEKLLQQLDALKKEK